MMPGAVVFISLRLRRGASKIRFLMERRPPSSGFDPGPVLRQLLDHGWGHVRQNVGIHTQASVPTQKLRSDEGRRPLIGITVASIFNRVAEAVNRSLIGRKAKLILRSVATFDYPSVHERDHITNSPNHGSFLRARHGPRDGSSPRRLFARLRSVSHPSDAGVGMVGS